MELKERIALARKQAGLSQEQLGEKLGVSRQAVSKWESGQTNPDVAYLTEMCRLFGVSADWLLLGEESAMETVPARCPGCQFIVTGLDKFCPNCGRSLEKEGQEKYENGRFTLLLNKVLDTYWTCNALCRIYNELGEEQGCKLPEGIEAGKALSTEDVRRLIYDAPGIICRNADYETVCRAREEMKDCAELYVYREGTGDSPTVLLGRPHIRELSVEEPPKEGMTFGGTVLAVILGVIGAILILSFL